jgi:D-arabinose 1-dehydrogenase-like Zn-dependent alcohol dehydrogenase
VSSWPSGHVIDSEEAIEFTQLEDISCMVEKYPLEKCNDAFSKFLNPKVLSRLIVFFSDAMMEGTVRFRAVIVM